jgi:sigma-B regulation protein RsbU (phosphoserine phosphatase)
MGRSFAARLIIPLTAAGALIIAGGLLLDYQLSRSRIVEGLEEQASGVTRAAAQRLAEMSAGVESSVRLIGEALHEIPGAEDADILLRSVVNSNPNIFGATIAPVAGSPVPRTAPYIYRGEGGLIRADLSEGGRRYWEEDWFRHTRDLGAASWVAPYVDETGGHVLMTTFSVPIYAGSVDNRGDFIAVATADVALADLHEYLEALRIGSSGFGFLLTRDGTLFGSPVGPVTTTPIAETLQLINREQDWSAQLESLQQGLSVDLAVRCPRSGEACRVRIQPVTGRAWSAGALYSEEELLRPLRNYETRVVTVGVVMLLTLAVVVSLITRRLTQPLLGLVKASESIARGDLDVRLPHNAGNDEIGQLIRAFDSMRQDLGTYIGEVERAAAQRSRMDGELSAAREIQMAMLPQGGTATVSGEHFELWASVRPAREVGGDLYSYQRYADRLLFSIGDVSDKGIPAALFMARAISLIQQWEVQPATAPPHIAMGQLNEVLSRDNENCMFLTLILGVINLNTRELSFASGGHSAPRLLRDGAISLLGEMNGPALGLKGDIDFSLTSLQLSAGDRLILFTDGFDEAVDPQEAMLGVDALDQLLLDVEPLAANEAGSAVFDAVDRFCDGAAQFDDMTLLLLELPAARAIPLETQQAQFSVDADICASALAWLDQQWQSQGLWEEGGHDLRLVLEELVCNVRDHASIDSGQPLDISLERHRDYVCLVSAEPAPAYNPLREAKQADLGTDTFNASVGGLGVHLITQLTDEQSYRRDSGRNILRLRKDIPKE